MSQRTNEQPANTTAVCVVEHYKLTAAQEIMTHCEFWEYICTLPPLQCHGQGLLGRGLTVQVVAGQSFDCTNAFPNHSHHLLFENGQI